MEDILDVYNAESDPDQPLFCLDEFCQQLLSEVADPIPLRPGTEKTTLASRSATMRSMCGKAVPARS